MSAIAPIHSAHAQVIAITNPAPALNELFGVSVGVLGPDHVVVGTQYDKVGSFRTGAAHLFDLTGQLVTSFTNPTVADDAFARQVSGLGTDKILVAASGYSGDASASGIVYVFASNGQRLATVTNPSPTPGDLFGGSICAIGTSHFVVGSVGKDIGASNAGAAYLFNTNWLLETVFTNPSPTVDSAFGFATAAVGSSRVLIGAYRHDTTATDSGIAYLFALDGSLLQTITNPVPGVGGNFGFAVAAYASNRLAIGTPGDNTVGFRSGAIHLFTEEGVHLGTIFNPSKSPFSTFGTRVVGVPGGRILASDYGEAFTGGGNAYLFNPNGTFVGTITNPAPQQSDQFGFSLVSLNSNFVAIGTPQDDTGSENAGTVYLRQLSDVGPPRLFIGAQQAAVTLSWPDIELDLQLETALSLNTNAIWTPVDQLPVLNNSSYVVTLPVSGTESNLFFRLRRP